MCTESSSGHWQQQTQLDSKYDTITSACTLQATLRNICSQPKFARDQNQRLGIIHGHVLRQCVISHQDVIRPVGTTTSRKGVGMSSK
jgi:hypothetical protein